MSESKVIFSLDNINLIIECSKNDKMQDICQKFSKKINKPFNSLLFIYERNQVNFEQTFQEQIKYNDSTNNEIRIFVYKNEDKKLLENIKSKYILEIIFSYIDEKIKLKAIKYNKRLQNILNIKFINYQFLSGKYIIYDSNMKGKEYDYNNELAFDGEYLNGERNGKGREYYSNGKLKYEGEYLNGKKNGLGKEYDYHGKLIFDGEYYKGYKWNGKGYDGLNNIAYELKNGKGKIKDFYYNAKIKFEGELLNGKKNGLGKEYHVNGNIKFEGEYLNGKRNGKGKEFNNLGNLIFEGEYKYGDKLNGKGYDGQNNIVYEMKNGKGKVIEYHDNGKIKSESEYLNGKKNGNSKEYHENGKLKFDIEYINGKLKGKGKEYYQDGLLKFEGEYLYYSRLKGKTYVNNKLEFDGEFLHNDKWNGKGYDESGKLIYELINGKGKIKEYQFGRLKYEGEYTNGKRNGLGKEYDYDGNLEFEGEYLDGKRNGKGKEYYNKKIEYEGEYLNGKRNGKGKEFNYQGKIIFEGEYKLGDRWNGKGYDGQNNIVYELKNGKGKVIEYYFNEIIKFEGEYLNGKKNGKVKEYNENGKLIFEGEYLNGERNGKGKEYYSNGKIKCDGEYLEGKLWNGKRKKYNYEGVLLSETEYKNGKIVS